MADDEKKDAAVRRPYGVLGNERIAAFSDGVFAVAITLLAVVLIEIPLQAPTGGLITLLPEFAPKLIAHIMTFAVLGIYWVGHHNMFLHVKRHDRILLWLNLLFLLFVAAMPFMTRLIAQFGDDRFALIAYAGTLMLAGLSLESIWAYATHEFRLVSPNLDLQLIAAVHRRVLLAPVVYLIAIGVCFVSIVVAKVLFLMVAVAYIAPDPLDHHHHRMLQE